MALSYLSQDDQLQWVPWLGALAAYQWTADQGKAVPPLALTWREAAFDWAAHAGVLLHLWVPTAALVDVTLDDNDNMLCLTWREPRLTMWRAAIQASAMPGRRHMAIASRQWWQAVQAINRAQVASVPWVTIRCRADTWTWCFDFNNYGDWDDPPLVALVHWLHSLDALWQRMPEVTA